MNYFNPQRTFIHEIGHFIARELNYSIFNVGLGVKEIYITGEENLLTRTIGYGGTIPKKPNNFIEDFIVHNPTELIAVLIYGCLFQCIYYNTEFNNCFIIKNSASGKKDAKHFSSIENISGRKRREIIEYINLEYINELKSLPNHFEVINNLKYENFILCKKEGNYIIDIEKLKKELNQFFTEHSFYYKKIVAKINEINEN